MGVVVPRTDAPCSCHLVKKSTAAAIEMVNSRGSSTGFLGLRISRRSPAEKCVPREDIPPPRESVPGRKDSPRELAGLGLEV